MALFHSKCDIDIFIKMPSTSSKTGWSMWLNVRFDFHTLFNFSSDLITCTVVAHTGLKANF